MSDYVSKEAFDSVVERLEAEDNRQNKRIDKLEETITAIHELAVNMEHMAKELEKQGKRLEVIESRDGTMWRTVLTHIVTLLVGAIVAFGLAKLGL